MLTTVIVATPVVCKSSVTLLMTIIATTPVICESRRYLPVLTHGVPHPHLPCLTQGHQLTTNEE